MTRVTLTALNRKYEKGAYDQPVRREEPIAARVETVGTCPICSLPVTAAPGQTLRTGAHKRCRKAAGIKKTDTADIALSKVRYHVGAGKANGEPSGS